MQADYITRAETQTTRKLSCRKDDRAMRLRMGALKIFGSLTTLMVTFLKIFNGLLFRLSL